MLKFNSTFWGYFSFPYEMLNLLPFLAFTLPSVKLREWTAVPPIFAGTGFLNTLTADEKEVVTV